MTIILLAFLCKKSISFCKKIFSLGSPHPHIWGKSRGKDRDKGKGRGRGRGRGKALPQWIEVV